MKFLYVEGNLYNVSELKHMQELDDITEILISNDHCLYVNDNHGKIIQKFISFLNDPEIKIFFWQIYDESGF